MKKTANLLFLVFLLAAFLMPTIYFSCQGTTFDNFFKTSELFCPVSKLNKAPIDYLLFIKNIIQSNLPIVLVFILSVIVYFSLGYKLKFLKPPLSLSLELINIRSSIKYALARGLVQGMIYG